MSDQFRISPEIVEDEIEDALSARTIDVDRPGFSSFLEVLRGARDGSVDRTVQIAYYQGLLRHLDQAEAAVGRMEVPPEIAAQMGPAFEATLGMLRDMREIVALFGDWLAGGHDDPLDRATALLEAVHGEVRGMGAAFSDR